MPQFSAFADDIAAPLLAGGFLADALRERLLIELPAAQGAALDALARAANSVRRARVGNRASLCAIISAKSGRCGENCAFCAQSGHHASQSAVHPFLPPADIAAAAATMQAAGVTRFGIVASGKALPEAEIEAAAQAVAAIAATGMAADASFGVLPADALERLQAAGLAAYHHNLETSRRHYPNICTTRTFDDNLAVLADCRRLGLPICSGGLFGLGETWEDRADLALTLLEAGAFSIPVNFLSPIPGTPLEAQPVLSRDEARRIVILLRCLLPDRHIRICGGRPTVFGPTRDNLAPLRCGADGLMVGDYLTTAGASLDNDKAGLADIGFEVGQSK